MCGGRRGGRLRASPPRRLTSADGRRHGGAAARSLARSLARSRPSGVGAGDLLGLPNPLPRDAARSDDEDEDAGGPVPSISLFVRTGYSGRRRPPPAPTSDGCDAPAGPTPGPTDPAVRARSPGGADGRRRARPKPQRPGPTPRNLTTQRGAAVSATGRPPRASGYPTLHPLTEGGGGFDVSHPAGQLRGGPERPEFFLPSLL